MEQRFRQSASADRPRVEVGIARTHVCTHNTHTHARTHIHTHTHTHAHTHAHTHTQDAAGADAGGVAALAAGPAGGRGVRVARRPRRLLQGGPVRALTLMNSN